MILLAEVPGVITYTLNPKDPDGRFNLDTKNSPEI